MKNRILFLTFVTVLSCCTYQQGPRQYADYSNSSGFRIENADSVSVENLVVLGKVWGFAKYHHPVFAGEQLNADYELFELLPKVAYATKDECNEVLLDWVQGLGRFRSVEGRLVKKIARRGYTTPADWEWLGDEDLLGVELSEKLQQLRWAKRGKPSRYAQPSSWRRSPSIFISFHAESTYSPFFSDTGYDLLTLFRLWNMAEYYFPSVNITNKKWSEVLTEYIPKFLSTGGTKWSTAELIAELSDTHSMIFSGNPIYSNRKLPVKLGFVEGNLIVTDSRKFPGSDGEPVLELGDEVISIDGHTPDYFVERARRYIAASNESVLLRNAAEFAQHVNDTVTNIVVQRDGKEKEFVVSTLISNSESEVWMKARGKTSSYELLNDEVGYINPDKCNKSDQAVIMEKFAYTKAIIVDMRCYPSEFGMPDFISDYFIPHKTNYVTWMLAVTALPGYYQKYPASMPLPHGLMDQLCSKNSNYYKGRVVILADAYTQSMAECIVMAFQAAPNCIVVGSQTAGADGNVVELPLPHEMKTLFSGIGVYYPDGTNAQRAGVRIDHYVEPTIEGIRAGRDEILEKALEIIESEYKRTEEPENL